MRALGAAASVALVLTASAGGSSAVTTPHFGPATLVASVDTNPLAQLQEIGTADVTGDGNADIVLTQADFQDTQDPQPEPVTILAGDGKGHFVDKTRQLFTGAVPLTVYPRRTVFGDFNHDGRTDIFIADTGPDTQPFPGHPNTLILSAPGGKLVDASANLPRAPDFTHSAAVGDVNGDGFADIYAGNLPNGTTPVPPEILINDGTAHFRPLDGALPADMADTIEHYDGSALIDVSGDGRVDLVLAGSPGTPNRVLLNDGTGHFHDLPNALPDKPWGVGNSDGLAVVPIDVNADGREDALIAYTKYSPFYQGRWIQVLVNDGSGRFHDETATRLPQVDNSANWPYAIEVADLNGDGKPDIGVSDWWYPTEVPQLYLNKGDGTFEPLPATAFRSAPDPTFVLLDANGDRRTDLYSVHYGHPQTHTLMLQAAPVVKPAPKPKPRPKPKPKQKPKKR